MSAGTHRFKHLSRPKKEKVYMSPVKQYSNAAFGDEVKSGSSYRCTILRFIPMQTTDKETERTRRGTVLVTKITESNFHAAAS